MAAPAILRDGRVAVIDIDGDRGVMTMAMTGKVGAMTLGAGAALAKVDGGIAVTVDPHSTGAVDRIMAGGARGVDRSDGVAGMAAHAECRRRYGGAMAVAVAVEVEGVTLGAGLAALNDRPRWRNF